MRATGVLAAALTCAGVLLLTTVTSQTSPAVASPGGDRFWAGKAYHGEFGAPSLLRIGRTYYAYATNTDGHNLPVMTSRNLRDWRARRAWSLAAGLSTWKGYNDAMPFPARWAAKRNNGKPGIWAPSVAELGGQYVDAYAVQMHLGSPRHCLTLATSPSPIGPFRDTSTKPLYCSHDPNGSIDPAWLQVHGRVYLIWKNAGVRGRKPTQVVGRRMSPDGTHFARHSRTHVLLQTARPWEGNVIEAPSPVVYHGRIYLFYSGNRYTTRRYAIGYAVCAHPLSRCHRVRRRPLLTSHARVVGPGAQSPIVDKHGRLRLAYSAWTRHHVGYPSSASCRHTRAGCNQRRMHIATLAAGRHGRLSVTRRG